MYRLAIVIGVVLTVSTLGVSPSWAEPSLSPNPVFATEQPVAQQKAPKADRAPHSFVTAAVNRVGPSVVRIVTERTISRRLADPLF